MRLRPWDFSMCTKNDRLNSTSRHTIWFANLQKHRRTCRLNRLFTVCLIRLDFLRERECCLFVCLNAKSGNNKTIEGALNWMAVSVCAVHIVYRISLSGLLNSHFDWNSNGTFCTSHLNLYLEFASSRVPFQIKSIFRIPIRSMRYHSIWLCHASAKQLTQKKTRQFARTHLHGIHNICACLFNLNGNSWFDQKLKTINQPPKILYLSGSSVWRRRR